jgi:very-short-patch-repair endonuclease
MRNRKKHIDLPYNADLKDRARELRKAGMLSEVLLWQQIHKKDFKGYDFDRQKIIGNYIVDFYCLDCDVVIEIDGSTHNEKSTYDARRDAFLEGLGLSVIHIDAKDILTNLNGVMEMLNNHPSLCVLGGTPTPALRATPPPAGN